MKHSEYDVVVVGAGPVGLSLAIELGMRGVSVLVLERNVRGGTAPRAKTTNTRTRAHLRRWGIADKLAGASPLGVDYPNDVHFVTSLSGHSLAVFRNAFDAKPVRMEDFPEHAQWVPQYTLERIMLEHAQTLDTVEIHFGTTFVTAVQEGEVVASTIQPENGQPVVVRSRYLIGADGARSAVRELIGAQMEGTYGLSRNSNVIFRAPGLDKAHRHGPGVMIVQVQRGGVSGIGPMDKGDIWYFTNGVPEGEELSDEEAIAAIRRTTGIDLPYEIVSKDLWVASELLADRYCRGRIILAGDACHLHPPFGGYGMNMGVGDGVDLGWKIAAELQSWGGPGLVATYEAERRPVHQFVIEEAVANHAMLIGSPWREGLDEDSPHGEDVRREVGAAIQQAKAREYHTLGTVLGLCYTGSPIIAREDGPAPEQGVQVYTPKAYPGCLAPHGWLSDGRSLYDAFGKGFALVAANDAEESEIEEACAEARLLGVPLEVIRPGDSIARRYGAKLALVRPDQIVAWRGDRWNGALRLATANVGTT